MPIPSTNASEELPAVNEILASVGQAPVTSLDQTNPDVAIAYNTLLRVSREVQSEGWSFNKELDVTFSPDSTTKEIEVSNDILQIDLTHSASTYKQDSVLRRKPGESTRKLYEKNDHTYEWTDDVKCDVIYEYSWIDLPIPIQDYIVSRAATIVSSRIVGDGQQYQMLQQKEQQARAVAIEYETNQGDYTFFGHPQGQNYYNSYQPYHALYR